MAIELPVFSYLAYYFLFKNRLIVKLTQRVPFDDYFIADF